MFLWSPENVITYVIFLQRQLHGVGEGNDFLSVLAAITGLLMGLFANPLSQMLCLIGTQFIRWSCRGCYVLVRSQKLLVPYLFMIMLRSCGNVLNGGFVCGEWAMYPTNKGFHYQFKVDRIHFHWWILHKTHGALWWTDYLEATALVWMQKMWMWACFEVVEGLGLRNISPVIDYLG